MAAGLHYTSSARTVQKALLHTVLLLLGDVAIHADLTENTVPLLRVQLLLF